MIFAAGHFTDGVGDWDAMTSSSIHRDGLYRDGSRDAPCSRQKIAKKNRSGVSGFFCPFGRRIAPGESRTWVTAICAGRGRRRSEQRSENKKIKPAGPTRKNQATRAIFWEGGFLFVAKTMRFCVFPLLLCSFLQAEEWRWNRPAHVLPSRVSLVFYFQIVYAQIF